MHKNILLFSIFTDLLINFTLHAGPVYSMLITAQTPTPAQTRNQNNQTPSTKDKYLNSLHQLMQNIAKSCDESAKKSNDVGNIAQKLLAQKYHMPMEVRNLIFSFYSKQPEPKHVRMKALHCGLNPRSGTSDCFYNDEDRPKKVLRLSKNATIYSDKHVSDEEMLSKSKNTLIAYKNTALNKNQSKINNF